MREELDKLLTEKYPKMTVNRYGSEMDTCMCYGFAVGDGWFNLLDQLMGNIQHYIDWKNREAVVVPQVTLDQVKSKFGGLRFYYTGGDDYISGMVSLAESLSEVTCEDCGAPGKRAGNGWVRTACEEHAPKEAV